MQVEYSPAENFRTILGSSSADALPDSDFTSKVLLDGLPAGQDIFYRVRFENLDESGIAGEAQLGRFRTAPSEQHSVSFVWSGDTLGQGWGIDPSRGGLRTYRTMRDNRPDFFIHCGDHIYADCPVEAELKLPNGEIWRNIVTEEKSVVAHSLAHFRGNYKYNWLDENLRAFHAEVPIFAQWDDHEVTNDWAPVGTADETGYAEDGTSKLVARARRAFHEFMPIRADAGTCGPHLSQDLIRPAARCLPDRHAQLPRFHLEQARRPERSLHPRARTTGVAEARTAWPPNATWKVIAADMPIGLISEDAVALGDGPPERREHEIADLLSFMKRAGIRNTVWLTADMHYTAAHHYDPNRAVFSDFEPFWEFVSGPLHAGTWAPAELDNTFGPKAMFQKGCSAEQGENLSAVFRAAILRPRRCRRQDRNHDRDPEGRRQYGSMVGRYRAPPGCAARSDHGAAYLRLWQARSGLRQQIAGEHEQYGERSDHAEHGGGDRQ